MTSTDKNIEITDFQLDGFPEASNITEKLKKLCKNIKNMGSTLENVERMNEHNMIDAYRVHLIGAMKDHHDLLNKDDMLQDSMRIFKSTEREIMSLRSVMGSSMEILRMSNCESEVWTFRRSENKKKRDKLTNILKEVRKTVMANNHLKEEKKAQEISRASSEMSKNREQIRNRRSIPISQNLSNSKEIREMRSKLENGKLTDEICTSPFIPTKSSNQRDEQETDKIIQSIGTTGTESIESLEFEMSELTKQRKTMIKDLDRDFDLKFCFKKCVDIYNSNTSSNKDSTFSDDQGNEYSVVEALRFIGSTMFV